MILGILGFFFSILGIVGYFKNASELLVFAVIYIIVEAVIGLCTGELRSVSTYITAVIIGCFVAAFTNSAVLSTIAVALCFENVIIGLASVVFLVIVGIAKNDHEKDNIGKT